MCWDVNRHKQESVYAHANGVGPLAGERDKCGDIYNRGFGDGRKEAIVIADKAVIYFVADGN